MVSGDGGTRRLLAIPARNRLERVLRYVLDETIPVAVWIRSISKIHQTQPFIFRSNSENIASSTFRGIDYRPVRRNSKLARADLVPGEFPDHRGAERYHHFYGKDSMIECPPAPAK